MDLMDTSMPPGPENLDHAKKTSRIDNKLPKKSKKRSRGDPPHLAFLMKLVTNPEYIQTTPPAVSIAT